MTPKEELFVREYLVDLNGAAAAVRAGFGRTHANTTGYRLRQRADVREAIEAGLAERNAALDISADRVLAEYARIAFSDMADFADFGPEGVRLRDLSALGRDQTAAIASLSAATRELGPSVRIRLHDKLAALDALARHIGLEAPRKVALTDAEGRDLAPEDPVEIARRIAFALRLGEEAMKARQEAEGAAEDAAE